MPDVPATVTPEITPGPQTSEFATMQNSAWWGKLMVILGIVSTTLSGIVDGIHEYQQSVVQATGGPAPGASHVAQVLLIIGIAMAVIGGIKKALSESAYITGRSLVKAAYYGSETPTPRK